MKKIRITENELISLIEKMVKENMGAIPSLSAQGGGFANLGMAKPTDKYKDLLEDGDVENVDEDHDGEEEQLNLSMTAQPGSDDEDAWMESIVDRLKSKLNEEKRRLTEDTPPTKPAGKGCAKDEDGSGCIKKGSYTDKDGDKYPWFIINNKHGGVYKGCTSYDDCLSILRVPAVHEG
tara:strand:- start:114 stop:647 length:534 start_codon:yes stop_codon:yes gene_type:complete